MLLFFILTFHILWVFHVHRTLHTVYINQIHYNDSIVKWGQLHKPINCPRDHIQCNPMCEFLWLICSAHSGFLIKWISESLSTQYSIKSIERKRNIKFIHELSKWILMAFDLRIVSVVDATTTYVARWLSFKKWSFIDENIDGKALTKLRGIVTAQEHTWTCIKSLIANFWLRWLWLVSELVSR